MTIPGQNNSEKLIIWAKYGVVVVPACQII